MPDENINSIDLVGALEYLEDYSLENKPTRIENYRAIQSILEREGHIDVKLLERTLAVCVHDLKEELKYTFIIMNMIPFILHKVKEGSYNPPLDLVPSALAVINILNTTALLNRVDTLRGMCYKTLLLFPDTTLTDIVEMNHTEILTMVNLYCHLRVPLEIQLQACCFLYKLLKRLPSDKRKTFIGKGIPVWFSKIIPPVMAQMQVHDADYEMPLKLLELLTENLIHFDYTNDESWILVLECICRYEKYPKVMQTLLNEGHYTWFRLWIVFIRLLKHQVTQSFGSIGTPINSMLPVVEAAFKVDMDNRCKAFECWNVLIDSFSTETNECNINKRIKLLIIPLKSNNAKTEDTALAKFKCWWHLITKFQFKMDRFLDVILVYFLQFIFGRHNAVDKAAVLPGQVTHNVKKQTVKAIVELVGHVNCAGCTGLQKLNGKILTTKHLVDNWDQWVYSINSTITIAATDPDVLTKRQIRCLWKSFILTIGELPDNNIREDLFFEILSLLKRLIQQSESNVQIADIVFNILLMSLFDGDPTIQVLLNAKKGDKNPINETLDMLQEPALKRFYERQEKKELVAKMKHVTDLVLNNNFDPTCVVGWFLLELPATDTALTIWTALAESAYENDSISIQILNTMLMWPLENINTFSDVKLAAIAWFRLYVLVHPKLSNTDFYEHSMNILLTPDNWKRSVLYFKLCVLLAHIECKLSDEQCLNKEVELLKSITDNVVDYNSIEQLIPMLVDIIQRVLYHVAVNVNETLASHALICFKNLFKIIIRKFNDQCNDHIFTLLEYMVKSIEKLIIMESYSKLGAIIISDDLLLYPSRLHGQCSIKSCILSLLQTIMQQSKDNNETLFSKIKTALDNLDNVTNTVDTNGSREKNIESGINKFTTPKIKGVPKKSKNKEPSIINTVSENGEEYVVVKSNWKFNPRKLTENQKERLKRKREDIPALYQDLSQSQDEFQLATWKTDSQDTSSSRSESKSNAPTDDATTILKNLPSSNVVPNILDNILTKDNSDNTNKTNDSLPQDISNRTEPVTPKNTKSPRLALKDRVFRNVRNLIEKSSMQKENKETEEQGISENIIKTPAPATIDVENKTETTPKTPKTVKVTAINNVINSAPSLISADRPSRMKRKPKKFDDVELLALKKGRHSVHGSSSDAKTVQTAKEVCSNKNKEALGNADNTFNENNVVDESNLIQVNGDAIEIHESKLNTNPKGNERVDNVVLINEKTQDSKVDDVANTSEETSVSKCEINKSNTDKIEDIISEVNVDNNEKVIQEIATLKQSNNKEADQKKLSAKKNGVRKSRIEKELAIDMVEGHPFLRMQSQKRLTRKSVVTPPPTGGRRKGLTGKLNKSKSDSTTPVKSNKNNKDKKEVENEQTSDTVNAANESSDASKDSTPEDHCSEDVIESSQDSTFSTLSVKSTKKTQKKIPLVSIEKLKLMEMDNEINVSQSILDCGAPIEIDSPKVNNCETKDDSEIPLNKTAVEEKSFTDLTENMDTEPINEADICDDVVIIDDLSAPLVVCSDETIVGTETQEVAEADTQPVDPSDYMETSASIVTVQNDITKSLIECAELQKSTDVSSPFKDDEQRNKEFFSNTLEISPIKTMSPDRCQKSPSPENNGDYVVIKLTSPVQSNGEPFDKCPSPEFFTDDKVFPDKRDQSPPRVEIGVTNTSPSSCLSLKKNRPQVRPGGRAAKMLVLCVPDNFKQDANPGNERKERDEPEETRRGSPSSTAARRNLRMLYNTEHNNHNDSPSETDDSGRFLNLRRSLPAVDSSPSGPILKRKLIEVPEDMISPASKRKRVSFHDPPVSTTVSVQKYIEPGGLRSPQNSAQKRTERQLRQFTVKSPKRLDTAFKLDTALTKTVESFTGAVVNNNADDTQPSSLDETPSVEIVKASELNDIDPICPELLECADPIDNIAGELSSANMKSLLVKELEGRVETVGDLAKMTELEVNRLCIKAPKVKIAKKVLADYAANKPVLTDAAITIDAAIFDETMNEAAPKTEDIKNKANYKVTSDMEVQTTAVPVACGSMQTELTPILHVGVQTNETGEGPTGDAIKCLLKRSDFIEELREQLQDSSIQQMCEKLPFGVMTDLYMKKVTHCNSDVVLSRLLEQQNLDAPAEDRKNNELYYLQDFLYDRFDTKDLMLFCSQLLQRLHDKSA